LILELLSRSDEDTQEFGRRLGACLRGGEVLAVDGDLGAGKTVFIRGLAGGLALDPDVVYSPSFTLVAEYPGQIPLTHIDLFRLCEPVSVEDFEEIGLREHLDPTGVTAIEWATRLAEGISAFTVRVAIDESGSTGRRIRLAVDSQRGKRILEAFQASIR
jgi:tRNA threonylcarbamoyladenosine biosynthesis protein TsaE